jgi:hypothetical protein
VIYFFKVFNNLQKKMSRSVNCFQYFNARQHFNENDHQKLAEFLVELIVDRFKSPKQPGNISNIVKVVESFYWNRNAREAVINKINTILNPNVNILQRLITYYFYVLLQNSR